MPKTKEKTRNDWEPKCIPVSELLGVADDYLTAACEVTCFAKDATSRLGMERIGKALTFTSKVVSLLGGAE